MIKFAFIQCDNYDDFTKCLSDLEKKFGEDKPNYIPTENGEVSGKVFVQIMLEKGYKVSSQRAKSARCRIFNIQRTKRGKEWWYKLADIERVPSNRFSYKKSEKIVV